MGMRQNIKMIYSKGSPVYLYSHWNGGADVNQSPLARVVREAITRRQRWDDESYLARIIVSTILKGDINGEVGYGIAPYPMDEEFPTIEVNLAKKTVNDTPYRKFITL